MLQKIFGIIDIFAAVLLFFGACPFPGLLANIIIFLLFVKGLISIFPMPFLYMPCILMDIVDIMSVIMIIFGDIILPSTFKTALVVIMLVKSLPSVLAMVLK